jgi:hypothetical protein
LHRTYRAISTLGVFQVYHPPRWPKSRFLTCKITEQEANFEEKKRGKNGNDEQKQDAEKSKFEEYDRTESVSGKPHGESGNSGGCGEHLLNFVADPNSKFQLHHRLWQLRSERVY